MFNILVLCDWKTKSSTSVCNGISHLAPRDQQLKHKKTSAPQTLAADQFWVWAFQHLGEGATQFAVISLRLLSRAKSIAEKSLKSRKSWPQFFTGIAYGSVIHSNLDHLAWEKGVNSEQQKLFRKIKCLLAPKSLSPLGAVI